jgi:alkylated DNA repair dioxygenase AlkB
MGRRMRDLLAQAGTADYPLAPGLTLLRHYLEEAAQRALASEIAEIVALAPWFFPCMPRSGRVFSVKMTNCGRLGWVSDREGGYRYQATHPGSGEPWPSIPESVLSIWRAVASYPHLPEGLPRQFLWLRRADGAPSGQGRGGARSTRGVDLAWRQLLFSVWRPAPC